MPQLNERRRKLISDLNITNFIDVILTVLIIFMITAPMMTRDNPPPKEEDDPVEQLPPINELKVMLPDPAVSARPGKEIAPFVIGVDYAGKFYEGNTVTTREHLIATLKSAKQLPALHIRVDIDRRAPAQALIELLDLFAYENLTDYAIHTAMPTATQ